MLRRLVRLRRRIAVGDPADIDVALKN